MIELLKKDLPSHYGLKRTPVIVLNECTDKPLFDITDKAESMIVEFGSGNLSLKNDSESDTVVINYEKYLSNFTGTKFEEGRKRCDFILYHNHITQNSAFILNEQTSASESTENLAKPILDKRKNVIYPSGKYEKAEYQLVESLKTLKAVEQIDSFISHYPRKVCLFSYIIESKSIDVSIKANTAFTRYKQLESKLTGDNGALLDNKAINDQGFEFRRIQHSHSFML